MATPRRRSDIFLNDTSGDFVVRRTIMPAWKAIALFLLAFMALYFIATNAQMMGGRFGVALAIFAVVGPLSWFTLYFSQQCRDLLLATEFQNALFSAAAHMKTKFMMIVRQDGSIFYYDRNFQEVFPETNSRGTLMIDKLFSARQITPAEAERLFRAIEEGRNESVFIHLPAADGGEDQKVIITVDPLPRPSGYFIIRGRDYVAKRSERGAQQARQPESPAAVPMTLQHLLHVVPSGLYTTNADGTISFINGRLESWLGYSRGEMIRNNLSLLDIIPQQPSLLLAQLLREDCEGEIQLQGKDGRKLDLRLRQEVTRDENGETIGSVGILESIAKSSPSSAQGAASPLGRVMSNHQQS